MVSYPCMNKVLNHNSITLLLLAAGQSRRFNGVKLAQPITDLSIDGSTAKTQPLLLHSLDKLNALSTYLDTLKIQNQVVIVLGHHQQTLQQLLPKGTKIIINEDSDRGLSSSIKTALQATEQAQANNLLITLADHIGISYSDYQQLVQLWLKTQNNVCAYYQEKLAAPAIFKHTHFLALGELQGDKGAKPLLKKLAASNELTTLFLANGIYDIDTEKDLLTWQKQFY
ncbi:hypothetical protein DS885_07490 [Psychromonas sp. B3M02]|nr:hypothetical protein DS885_07490 [Psychromonas sp. B3M02]